MLMGSELEADICALKSIIDELHTNSIIQLTSLLSKEFFSFCSCTIIIS